MVHDISQSSSRRVHAIILTRDRVEECRRCVDMALSTLGRHDFLTILDDSGPTATAENLATLASSARRSNAVVTHLMTAHAHDAVARAHGGSMLAWQHKSAPRDIAPLRNLSLLLSSTVGAHTTVLIDDDVVGFDLAATHEFIAGQQHKPNGIVVGAEIGGWTELDTVTRLEHAMVRLTEQPYQEGVTVSDLFRAASVNGAHGGKACQWVSAGYMAFNVQPSKLLAFPPGYNEDWVWCLLQHAEYGTRILKSGHTVLHEPAAMRRPTCDDIQFELMGDLILDALVECGTAELQNGASVLCRLRGHQPDSSILPASRVAEAMQQAAETQRLDRMHPDLWEYGLRALNDVVRGDMLEGDGTALVSAWCHDAETKQIAFAPMPRNAVVLAALETLMIKGRV